MIRGVCCERGVACAETRGGVCGRSWCHGTVCVCVNITTNAMQTTIVLQSYTGSFQTTTQCHATPLQCNATPRHDTPRYDRPRHTAVMPCYNLHQVREGGGAPRDATPRHAAPQSWQCYATTRHTTHCLARHAAPRLGTLRHATSHLCHIIPHQSRHTTLR